MSKVTRKLKVALAPNQIKLDRLHEMARGVRELRSDAWALLTRREHSAVALYGFRDLMKEHGFDQHRYGLPQRVWRQNVETTYREIRLWQESAKTNHDLKRKIYRRAGSDKTEQRRLLTALKTGDWLSDPWLHKHTRQAFRAKPKPNRQKLRLSWDGDSYDLSRDQNTGQVWVSLLVSTSGERVKLCLGRIPDHLFPKGEVQLFFHGPNDIQFHIGFDEYYVCAGDAIPEPAKNQSVHAKMREAKKAREAAARGEALVLPPEPASKPVPPKPFKALGVDAGRTEVFIDSHGTVYGHGFGELCEREDATRKKRNGNRNKVHAHEKKLRERAQTTLSLGDGETAARLTRKANNLRGNTLGRTRLTAARNRHKARVRDLIYRASHEVAKSAEFIAHEKFSKSFSFDRGRRQNRLNSGWMRKIIAEAVPATASRRGSLAVPVNPAYTSQQVRACGHLGKRTNGTVYCTEDSCPEYGVRYHDDMDAAGVIQDRAADPHITLAMTPKQVRQVILSRYPAPAGQQQVTPTVENCPTKA